MAHGICRTKGGRNTKLHAVCDEKGRPCVLLLTPGNVRDCKVAKLCIEMMPPSAELVADKGYDSQALREWLVERGTEPVIPPRKNRKVNNSVAREAKHFETKVLFVEGDRPFYVAGVKNKPV